VAKPKRLAYVSLWDARDPNAESGYPYAMLKQLEKHFSVLELFPLRVGALRFFHRRVIGKLTGRYYHHMREPAVLRRLATSIDDFCEKARPDILFLPTSIPLTCVRSPLPSVVATDQVFASLEGTYIKALSDRFRDMGSAQERMALHKASRITFPSHWAADTAQKHYHLPANKIRVIPWGANVDKPPKLDQVISSIERRLAGQCTLVFIGRDWHRKGGDVVISTLRCLAEMGVEAELIIIGCRPPIHHEALRVTIYPFLNKHIPADALLFSEIMSKARFLFVPSRAEAFGQCFCEAAAFGTPALSYATGGIPTIIQNGTTGFILPTGSSPEMFAHIIFDTVSNRSIYRSLALQARRDFECRLNWDSFGDNVAKMIVELLNSEGRRVDD